MKIHRYPKITQKLKIPLLDRINPNNNLSSTPQSVNYLSLANNRGINARILDFRIYRTIKILKIERNKIFKKFTKVSN